MSAKPTPVHLIIVIHGLYGSTLNLKVVEEELIRAGGEVERGAEADNDGGPPTSSKTSTGHGVGGAAIQGDLEGKGSKTGTETVVYLAQSIKGTRTWDGIDVCSHRITEEVSERASV